MSIEVIKPQRSRIYSSQSQKIQRIVGSFGERISKVKNIADKDGNAKLEDALSINLPSKQELDDIQFQSALRQCAKHLPETHETVLHLQRILNIALSKIGLRDNDICVSVYENEIPNAHIIPSIGRINITHRLLEALEHDEDLILAVMAHEIGHFKAYAKRDDAEAHEASAVEEAIDYTIKRVNSYEEEYQADQYSIILMMKLKKDPRLIGEALEKLEKAEVFTSDDDDKPNPAWFIKAHPYLGRRVKAINRLASQLPKGQRSAIKTPSHTYEDLLFAWEEKATGVIRIPENHDYDNSTYVDEKDVDDLRALYPHQYIEPFSKLVKDLGSDESKFLDCSANEVNQWGERETGNRIEWWSKALNNIVDIGGQDDFLYDFEEYDNDTCRRLLKDIQFFIQVSRDEGWAAGSLWNEDYDSQVTNGHRALANMLFEKAFQSQLKELNAQTLKGICEFLRDFRLTTGRFLPLSKIKLLAAMQKAFKNCTTEQENQKLCDICNEYEVEIVNGHERWVDKFKKLFEEVNKTNTIKGFVGRCPEKRLDGNNIYSDAERGIMELSPWRAISIFGRKYSIETIDEKETIIDHSKKCIKVPLTLSSEEKEVAIREIFAPYARGEWGREMEANLKISIGNALDEVMKAKKKSTPQNIQKLISLLQGKTKSEKVLLQIGADAEDTTTYDRLHDASFKTQMIVMGEEEFKETYIGSGRHKLKEIPYITVCEDAMAYQYFHQLWEKFGYPERIESGETMHEKLSIFHESYPLESAYKDQHAVVLLGWPQLEFISDVQEVQPHIVACEDVYLLFLLRKIFSNPYLHLTITQRLEELKSAAGNQLFLSTVPSEELAEARIQLEGSIKGNDEILAILICHPYPSHQRDSLLRPFIDGAPNKEAMLSLASFLREPPVGAMVLREASHVTIFESFLDIVQKAECQDKEELLLYLIGHREFVATMESYFPNDMKEKGIEFLRNHILYNPIKWEEGEYYHGWEEGKGTIGLQRERYKGITECVSIKLPKNMDDGHVHQYSSIPDTVVFMVKNMGIPIEMLFEQGKDLMTKAEQEEMLSQILLGRDGILHGANKGKFLYRVAELLINRGEIQELQDPEKRQKTIDLFTFALSHCPEKKLPNLYLNLWHILSKGSISIPELITQMIQEYGAVFIKAGQYIATQTTALSKEWIESLRKLADKNQKADKTLLYYFIEHTYNGSNPFKQVGEKLAEGSMAAVYNGELSDGTDVAVKVVHPWIRNELEEDIDFLDQLVQYINASQEAYGIRLPSNVAAVIHEQMLEELEIEKEAKNNDLLRAVLSKESDGIQFNLPSYKAKHSRDNFYVLDKVNGIALDDNEGMQKMGLEGQRIREAVGKELIRQILVEGVYHGDPNMGNFKVEKNSENRPVVHWLDTGNVVTLSEEDNATIHQLFYEAGALCEPQNVAPLLQKTIKEPGETTTIEIEGWLQKEKFFEYSQHERMEHLLHGILDFCLENKYVLKGSFVKLIRTVGMLKPLFEK